MSTDAEKLHIARQLHRSLISKDWNLMRSLLTDDASWVLPGTNRISGPADGPDAVVERAKLIASFGLNFELRHILLRRNNMALSLHNTASRGNLRLDEYLST